MDLYFGLFCSLKMYTQKFLLFSFVQNVVLTPEKLQKLGVGVSKVAGKEAVLAWYNSYCVDEVRLFCVQSGMC